MGKLWDSYQAVGHVGQRSLLWTLLMTVGLSSAMVRQYPPPQYGQQWSGQFVPSYGPPIRQIYNPPMMQMPVPYHNNNYLGPPSMTFQVTSYPRPLISSHGPYEQNGYSTHYTSPPPQTYRPSQPQPTYGPTSMNSPPPYSPYSPPPQMYKAPPVSPSYQPPIVSYSSPPSPPMSSPTYNSYPPSPSPPMPTPSYQPPPPPPATIPSYQSPSPYSPYSPPPMPTPPYQSPPMPTPSYQSPPMPTPSYQSPPMPSSSYQPSPASSSAYNYKSPAPSEYHSTPPVQSSTDNAEENPGSKYTVTSSSGTTVVAPNFSKVNVKESVQISPNEIPIIYLKHQLLGTEENHVDFKTGNGIESSESTRVIPVYGGDGYSDEEIKSILVKTGRVAWTSPEGIRVFLVYRADETGYHPQVSMVGGRKTESSPSPVESSPAPPTQVTYLVPVPPSSHYSNNN